jgi:PEP-CTERM motif
LPSQGRAFDAYGFNLWPRDASVPAGNAQIADFAPDNSNAIVSRVTAVPEPETYLLFAIGLLPVARALRRERRRARAGSDV